MELIYCCILLIAALLSLHLLKLKPKREVITNLLPPGPRKLPVFGSLHHLAGSLPHHSLRRLSAAHGPVIHLQLGEILLIVVSSADAAHEVLKIQDLNFASRPCVPSVHQLSYGGKDFIFSPYGPFWRQMRRLCIVELLGPKRLATHRAIREQEVHRLVRSINSAQQDDVVVVVDLSKKLVELTSNILMRAVIGRRCREQDEFQETLWDVIESVSGFSTVDLFPSLPLVGWLTGARRRIERMFLRMDRMLNEIVREHVEKRRGAVVEDMEEDLLNVLLRIQEEGGLQFALSIENIKAVIMDMFVAGSETTSTTLEWAMAELINNPKAMSIAQKEARSIIQGKIDVSVSETETLRQLSYINLVIKETLRLHPPAPLLLPRECRETCCLLGYEIPANARIVVNSWAIGRDPKYWDDADDFKPERFDGPSIGSNALLAESFKGSSNFEYLPFGAGRRMCPGIDFGLATVALTLAQLLCFFDWEKKQEEEELDMREKFGLTSRKKTPLFLRPVPHDGTAAHA